TLSVTVAARGTSLLRPGLGIRTSGRRSGIARITYCAAAAVSKPSFEARRTVQLVESFTRNSPAKPALPPSCPVFAAPVAAVGAARAAREARRHDDAGRLPAEDRHVDREVVALGDHQLLGIQDLQLDGPRPRRVAEEDHAVDPDPRVAVAQGEEPAHDRGDR